MRKSAWGLSRSAEAVEAGPPSGDEGARGLSRVRARACVVVCEEKEELSAASEASSTVSVQEQESEKRPRKSAKKRQNK